MPLTIHELMPLVAYELCEIKKFKSFTFTIILVIHIKLQRIVDYNACVFY